MVKSSAKKLATSQRKQWQKILQSNEAVTDSGSNKALRIVIDTNVWYSGILYGEKPEMVIRLSLNNFQIVISEYIVKELRQTLKLQAKAPYKWLNFLEKHLRLVCEVIDLDEIPKLSRDPKDDPVIATGIGGNCYYLVTGDRDLLALKSVNALKIISVKELLKLAKRSELSL
ncbi:MAG: putative toxin-antitoxin system toxin component, PIN family [Nitrosotalea sp.]